MCDIFFRPSGAWGDFTRIPHPRPGTCEKIKCANHRDTESRRKALFFQSLCLSVSVVLNLSADFFTRSCAMGYDLSPASRAAKRGRYRSASGGRCWLIDISLESSFQMCAYSSAARRTRSRHRRDMAIIYPLSSRRAMPSEKPQTLKSRPATHKVNPYAIIGARRQVSAFKKYRRSRL